MCALDEFALGEQSPNFSSTGYHTPRGTCGVLDSALREAKLCVAFFVQQQLDNFKYANTRQSQVMSQIAPILHRSKTVRVKRTIKPTFYGVILCLYQV